MNHTLRCSLLLAGLLAATPLVGCGSESTSSGGLGPNAGAAGAAAGSSGAGNGGSSSGSGGTSAGSGGSNAGSGGTAAGSGGSDAGSGGSDAGSGGTDAGSGGSKAGSGGTDAGSGGSEAGSGGTDAGSGGSGGGGISPECLGCLAQEPCAPAFDACAQDEACLACADNPATEECLKNSKLQEVVACGCKEDTCGASACASECALFGGGQGGSSGAAGSGGGNAGSGGSTAGVGGSSSGSGGSSAGSGGSSAGSGGSSAGSGGFGGAPLTCADVYNESKCGQCGEKNCCPEMDGCLKDADCLACLQGDDAKCTGNVYDKLNGCLDTKCKDACAATCNDGGIDYGFGSFACDTCQIEELSAGGCCAAEAEKCIANQACVDLHDCLEKCTTEACANQCATQFSKGINDYQALLDCTFGDGSTFSGACGIACGSKSAACSDGGKEHGSGAAACDKCQETELSAQGCCAIEASACVNNNACVDLNTCLEKCSNQACVDQCAQQFPNGVGHYNDLIDCLYGPEGQHPGACGAVCQ